jgi:UPF0716 protein FxsA
MLRFWPVLFFLIPLVEVYVLIQVGSQIGAGWTIFLVVLTAVIGVNLLRHQGLSTLMRATQLMQQGQIPAMEMFEGIFLAVGGALLITPGFFTDTLGFICLLPYTRRGIIRYLLLNSTIQSTYSVHKENTNRPESKTIEGEFHRED